jgi:hypothetical protein
VVAVSLVNWLIFAVVLWIFLSLPVSFFMAQVIRFNERPYDQERD